MRDHLQGLAKTGGATGPGTVQFEPWLPDGVRSAGLVGVTVPIWRHCSGQVHVS